MTGKIVNYFENLSKTNKIGHAFLVCNCTLPFIEVELNTIISKYFFNNEVVNIRINEDIILIEPENNIIKKEKIYQIHEKMKITSQLHDKKIYIIADCEKMNDSAANSLLKLLEEPSDNIYAFLITSNIDNVIKTIYSRCQILNYFKEDENNILLKSLTPEMIEEAFKFLEVLEKKKMNTIANYGFIIKKVKDREYLRNFFKTILLIYREILNLMLNMECNYFKNKEEKLNKIIELNTQKSIIDKLMLTIKYVYYVDLNLNTNLLLDRFIIEIAGEENE